MKRGLLSNVHPGHTFKMRDGAEIKNLRELAERLDKMDVEDFKHHVNDERNDFHSWISHIVKDGELAGVLATVRNKREMAEMVKIRIAGLQTKKSSKPKKQHHFHEHKYSPSMEKEHAILSWGKDKNIKYAMTEFFIGFVVGLVGAVMLVQAMA